MNKDDQIIEHIYRYCLSIQKSIKRFGNENDLKKDTDYFHSVCMQLLQIGELTKGLSDEFINSNNKIDWKGFKGARDVMAHQYHNVNFGIIWNGISQEVPELKKFCEEYMEGCGHNDK